MAAPTFRPDARRDAAALDIAEGAGQWLKVTLRIDVEGFPVGTKFYGVPSATTEGTVYFTNLRHCSCPDAKRRPAIGCKHRRAVALHVRRVREARQQPQQEGEAPASPTPAPARRRKSRRKTIPAVAAAPAADYSCLSAIDVRRLTLYKWRYSLESAGFTAHEAVQILFLKWLAARQPVAL